MLWEKLFRPGSLIVALVILALVFSFAGCIGKYPTHQVFLVWETTIPSGSAVINVWDSGEADVRPSRVGDIVPPIVHFNGLGQPVAEFDKADIPCRYSTSLSHPTKVGWIVRDVQASPISPYSFGSGLESLIKLVTRDGHVAWETRGPADAYVMYTDDSVVVCRGKDPAVLDSLPDVGSTPSYEFNDLVKERYQSLPHRIMVLGTATGEIVSQFDIPNTLEPEFVFRASSLSDSVIVHCEENELKERADEWHGTWSLTSRVTWYNSADGQTLLSLDLREAMPEALIDTVIPWHRGLLIVDTDNRITALAENGSALWQASPKGALAHSFSSLSPMVSYDDVLLPIAVYNLNAGPDADTDRFFVFDDKGKALFDLGGLSRVQRAVTADRVIAVANDPRTTEMKYAYVIDLAEGKVEVSQARIPSFSGFALSPSGEFLALVGPVSESECVVSVYGLEGIE